MWDVDQIPVWRSSPRERGWSRDRRAGAGLHDVFPALHGRGLAGPLGSQDAEDLALLDGETDPVHRGVVAVALDEAVYPMIAMGRPCRPTTIRRIDRAVRAVAGRGGSTIHRSVDARVVTVVGRPAERPPVVTLHPVGDVVATGHERAY
ncbi:hypothetical protein, partial [Saccharothrix stipae]